MDQDETNRRFFALEMATKAGEDSHETVERVKQYYDFLTNKDGA